MMSPVKSKEEILRKLGIEALNPMQEEAFLAIRELFCDVVLLSPTGTGKTLAFLLPLIAALDPKKKGTQALIVVPSRELAIQIEQVVREMGSGYKANAVYGGRSVSKDKLDLQHEPSILIGTPGRVADHLRRGTITVNELEYLVLDEFDKSLEVGFEEEMSEIIAGLPQLNKRILTSATQGVELPHFVQLQDTHTIDYLGDGVPPLAIKRIVSPEKDKLETLYRALCQLGGEPGIVFLNFKDSIERVSTFLAEKEVNHACFFGGLEQQDRERALLKFRNGTHQLLLATDLAARGIDVPEIKYIIHYHLPHRAEEFTHRNGRTARMHQEGTAYVLHWTEDELPEFIDLNSPELELADAPPPEPSEWETVFISGGRRDKISKGDIAGLFFKKGQLKKEELGAIELKPECAFVAVHYKKVDQVVQALNNTHLKKRKLRVTVV